MKKLMFAAFALALAAVPAHANLVWFSPLDPTAAPPSTMGPYSLLAAGDDTRPNGQFVTGVGVLSFDEAVIHTEVGAGWATWSHGYTGDVYTTPSSTNPDSLTMSLPSDMFHAVYFYAEPNIFSTFALTAVADGGSVLLTQLVAGFSGAKFFGVYDDGGGFIDSIKVTSQSGAGGFAVGEFGGDLQIGQQSAPVPEPGTLMLLGGGLLGLYRKARKIGLSA